MANARAIVKRRKAVGNIKKITRTMQLIATAKFQQCLKRATATQPYTAKLTDMVNKLSSQVTDVSHPLLEINAETGRTAVLVITSNRGLCGSYNANVVRLGAEHLKTKTGEREVALDVVGNKGGSYFRFLGNDIRHLYKHFDDRVTYDQVETLANQFIHSYEKKDIDAVHVVYTKFISAARQKATVLQLLPLQSVGTDSAEDAPKGASTQYDFSPEPKSLLNQLLPESVRVQLFQCFTDSIVSEQVSRMVAMKAATDAAGDMIKSLTRTYNRARQTQITMELLDITGGAEALKG